MTMASCLHRTVSPVLNGVIWAFSLSEENRRIGFPVDYHLIFVLFGFIYLVCVFIVALLPKSINKQKRTPAESNEEAGQQTEGEGRGVDAVDATETTLDTREDGSESAL